MDHSIVKDFQNLRVFSNRNIIRMDELVQDLTNALEETSKAHNKSQTENLAPGVFARRLYKKRRGKRRRSDPTPLWKCGTISEASESSIEEALKDYIDTVALLSDSDDIAARRIHRLTVPLTCLTDPTPPVESDSVTENVSPIRPPRRRRKFKSMALDSPNAEDFVEPSFERFKTKHKTLQNTNSNMVVQEDMTLMTTDFVQNQEGTLPGKRKRSTKSRSDYVKQPAGGNSQEGDIDGMDVAGYSQESSSLSSSESEGLITNDEGREADDEQSDFFLEPGPSCGIAGIIPWWENERVTDSDMVMDKQLENILTGSFDHMPEESKQSFKSRVSRLMASSGREIRLGRRKLRGKMPSYTMTRFLQDRQRWSQMQGRCLPSRPSGQTSSHSGDFKRQRKTPPSSPQDEGYVGDCAEPIPEHNIGNKMLQSMGWNPGSGLGSRCDGIQNPIQAYVRMGRSGLGYDSNSLSDT